MRYWRSSCAIFEQSGGPEYRSRQMGAGNNVHDAQHMVDALNALEESRKKTRAALRGSDVAL